VNGWLSSEAWPFYLIAFVLLIAFVMIERRATHPLLPLRVVLDRDRGGSYLTSLLIGLGLFGMFLFLTTTCRSSCTTPRSGPGSRSCRSPPASSSVPG
jgi:hypothetical protein